MRRRLAAAALLAAALGVGGCSGDPAPAPDPSSTAPSPTASASSGLSAATVARFRRTPVVTTLGDLTTLDVCGLAASADLRDLGSVRLERPDHADVAACTLTSRPTGTLARSGSVGSISVTVRSTAPGAAAPFDSTPTRTLLTGRPLANYPFNASSESCPRVLTAPRVGFTVAFVSIVNTGGAGNATPAQMCLLNLRIAARFVYVAGAGTRPPLPVSSPSLLSVAVCRAAASGRVAAAIGATGSPLPTAYGAGCAFPTDLGTVELITGTLAPGVTRPAGATREVDGRDLVLLPTAAPTCGYAWYRGREVMTARLTSATKSVPADCVLAGDALDAYLDSLGLT